MRAQHATGLAGTLLRVYRPPGSPAERGMRPSFVPVLPNDEPHLPRALKRPRGEARLEVMDFDAMRRAYAALPGAESIRHAIITDADRVLAEQLRFYGGRWVDTGWPPAWHRNPETGHEHPRDAHWSAVSDHDLASGDINTCGSHPVCGGCIPCCARSL